MAGKSVQRDASTRPARAKATRKNAVNEKVLSVKNNDVPPGTNRNPVVTDYIVCSLCKTAYVLRRCFNIDTGKTEWLFQRDCTHKHADPIHKKA